MSPEVTVRDSACEPGHPGEEYFAFPLTPGQAAMLPKNLDSTEDPRFNGAFRMNLDGPVNAVLLEHSLREIVRRHEVLRTTFQTNGVEVLQIVRPNVTLALNIRDLRKYSGDSQVNEIDMISLEEAQTGFDLTKAPPLRASLLCLSEANYMLVLTLHQIICDGWSIGVLMDELSKIYTASARQQPSPLEPVTFQYGDYVVWQRDLFAQPEIQAQREYWKNQLRSCTQIQVSPDYAVTSASIKSDIVSQLLPRELTEQLRTIAQAENTTFFVVTMAACMALLYRYTSINDVALRTPLAGRTRVEFESLIGQFTNQVIVRSDLSNNLTFRDLLARVRDQVWEALANQDVPFETVVQDYVGSNTIPTGLFNINFVCQREYGRSGPFQFELDGIKMTTLPSKSQGALYNLNFFLVEREVGWRLSLEYKTDLYSRETAESLLIHFQELLGDIVVDPQTKIIDLALSDSEALNKRNRTNVSTGTDNQPQSSIDDLSQGVQAIPASFAQERFWTLSEVDPENPAFHMPVTLRLAGKLSVPFLEESFRLLVNRHEMLRTTFSEIDGELMQVIHDRSPFALEKINIDEAPGNEQTALLDTTVQRMLREPFDLSSLPLFRAALCRLAPEQHILILSIHHSIADAWSIQIFQRELWTAYENFGKDRAFSFDPLPLQYGDFSIWQKQGISSEATQQHIDFWLKSLSGDLPVLNFPTDRAASQQNTSKSSLESLLFADELSQSLKQLAQLNDTTLYVVTLTCFSLLLSRASCAQDLIIGSPVANRRSETEPLMGPFAGPVALRLQVEDNLTIRDLIVANRNKTVEALGHTEVPFEVLLDKLDVRPVLGRSPLFQFYFFCQTAFLQSRDLPDLTITPLPSTSVGMPFEMQLAVIERKEGVRAELEYNANLFDKSTIREWLEYYQTLLHFAAASPDRKISELPAPPHIAKNLATEAKHKPPFPKTTTGSSAAIAESSEALHDPLTSDLAGIWQSALNIDAIGLHDNFFVLGGRSLVAARLIAKINKKYSLKLGLATLFNCPTIAELAALIRGQLTPQVPSSIVAVQPEGTSTPLFVVHGVGGNVLNFYDLAKSLGSKYRIYGVEAQSLQPEAVPLTKLEDLAAYYIQEVRKIQPIGPYNFLGYSYGGFVAFEMARQLQIAGEKVDLLGMLDTPVWRHAVHEDNHPIAKAARQVMAVWSPFFHRLRPCTPMEIFDGIKSTILRTFYTFAALRKMTIPSRLRSVYHINSFAAVNYVPKAYDGAVTLLRASREKGPRDLGWSKFTTQPARVFEIPGAHLQVLSNENLPRVARSLRQCLL
jgi:non-ribosomal peptide synthetase component F/thioesterase domain-containing protein